MHVGCGNVFLWCRWAVAVSCAVVLCARSYVLFRGGTYVLGLCMIHINMFRIAALRL